MSIQPIPLELLTLLSFQDPPQQRGTSLLRAMRGGEKDRHGESPGEKPETNDSRMLYPCSVHHAGRVGGHHQLFAESAQVRAEWKRRLDEAMGLRRAVQEANKVRYPFLVEIHSLKYLSHARSLKSPRSVPTLSLYLLSKHPLPSNGLKVV